MAEAMQGIMSLAEGQQMDQGQLDMSSYSPEIENYAKTQPRNFSRDILGGMAEVEPETVDRFIRQLAAMDLPPDLIDAMQLMVDNILANPGQYAQDRVELIEEGVPAELLPEQFDPVYFSAFNIALDQLEINRPQVPEFAKGGIINAKTIARELAKMGRNGDTMLAHITPSEARLLRSRGGSGTINPKTGLPEFFFKKIKKAIGGAFKGVGKAISSIAKGIGNVVKDIAGSTIGKIALTFAAVYFMGPAGLNLAGSAGSLTGITNAVAANVVNTVAGSTLVNLASGQKIGDALKGGIVSGALAGAGTAVFGGGVPGTKQAPAPVIDKSINLASTAGTTLDDAALIGVPTPTSIGPGAVTASTPLPGVGAAQTFPLTSPPPVVGTPIGAQAASLADDFTPSFTQNNAASQFFGNKVPAPVAGAAPVQVPTPAVQNIQAPVADVGSNLASKTVPPPVTAPKGIMDLLGEGKYGEAASSAWNKISPSGIKAEGTIAAQQAGESAVKDLLARTPTASQAMQDAYFKTAYDAAMPGVIAQYGPMVGLGLGAATLFGGFKTPNEQLPENAEMFKTSGADLLAKNPEKYGLDFGGVRTSYAANPYEKLYSGYKTAEISPARMATGGIASLKEFPRKTGPISGPGTGTSDSVPAMLSDGEFVFTAKAVRAMGDGSRRKGAKRMYALMKKLETKGK